jgi:hypothetical protein
VFARVGPSDCDRVYAGKIPSLQYATLRASVGDLMTAGLCQCGCGKPAPIADCTRRGYRKGQPLRFIHGHNMLAKYPQAPAYSGPRRFCACGCGKPAPIAERNEARYGWRKGHPLRYIRGHHARITNRKHGMSNTPEYWAYRSAKQRCTNPKDEAWPDYGGRGIRFVFASFEKFYAQIGPRPTPADSLDRIDVNGHYEAGNVRWADWHTQQTNKRTSEDAEEPF